MFEKCLQVVNFWTTEKMLSFDTRQHGRLYEQYIRQCDGIITSLAMSVKLIQVVGINSILSV